MSLDDIFGYTIKGPQFAPKMSLTMEELKYSIGDIVVIIGDSEKIPRIITGSQQFLFNDSINQIIKIKYHYQLDKGMDCLYTSDDLRPWSNKMQYNGEIQEG